MSILKLHGSVYIGEGTAQEDSPYGSFKAGETYRRDRWSAGLELKAGPVYLRSEYMEGLDASVRSRGAYATLTGSPAKFLDIVASVDYLDRNIALSDWQCNYIFGLCRLQAQYVYQQRSKDSKGIYSGIPSSHMIITQLQVGF